MDLENTLLYDLKHPITQNIKSTYTFLPYTLDTHEHISSLKNGNRGCGLLGFYRVFSKVSYTTFKK